MYVVIYVLAQFQQYPYEIRFQHVVLQSFRAEFFLRQQSNYHSTPSTEKGIKAQMILQQMQKKNKLKPQLKMWRCILKQNAYTTILLNNYY